MRKDTCLKLFEDKVKRQNTQEKEEQKASLDGVVKNLWEEEDALLLTIGRYNTKLAEVKPGVESHDKDAVRSHAEFSGLLASAKQRLKATRQKATRAENKVRAVEAAKYLVQICEREA